MLEAKLLSVAKMFGYNVIGVDPVRAAEYRVPVAVLVQAGNLIPSTKKRAKTTGYYGGKKGTLKIDHTTSTIDHPVPSNNR